MSVSKGRENSSEALIALSNAVLRTVEELWVFYKVIMHVQRRPDGLVKEELFVFAR